MQGVHLLPRGYSIIMACKGEVSLERGTFYRLQVYDSMFTDGSIFSSKSVERVTKSKKPRRIYWPPAESCRQCKEVRVGEEENRRSLFFFLALRARSRALASLVDVFEKNEEKNKTTSIYRLMGERLDKFNLFFPQRCLQTFFIIIFFSHAPRSPMFRKERREKWNNGCVQARYTKGYSLLHSRFKCPHAIFLPTKGDLHNAQKTAL